jgi:hypothetical protein
MPAALAILDDGVESGDLDVPAFATAVEAKVEHPAFWSCGVAGQRPRDRDESVIHELVETVGPGDFKAQVDALRLGWELAHPSVANYEAALRVYAHVQDARLLAKKELGRLFAREGLGPVDDDWRRDARALVVAWLDGGDDRRAPRHQITRRAAAQLAAILGDAELESAIERTPETPIYELSPWGKWALRVHPSLVQLVDDL